MRKTVSMMSKEEREKAAKMIGNTVLMLEEGYSTQQIGEELGLDAWQVDHNIREILYFVRKHLGRGKVIKELFVN